MTEIPIGAHRIEFAKDCFVRSERRQNIEQLDDYVLDPIKLDPAVATLNITSNQGGSIVLIDDQQRGVAPLTISDVCEGDHLVEMKSATGRFFRRIDARTGLKIAIEGVLKPAFAIVSASGPAALNTDLRTTIEKQMQPSQTITLFAPAQGDVAKALATEKLPQDWLAFDLNKRPLGTAGEVAPAMRSDLSEKLSKQFEAQGIASVTVPTAGNRNRLVVTFLASRSSDPDVLEVNLDSIDSVNQAIGRLDRGLSFFKPSIGITLVDVADLEGPVVVAVDANGPGARAGVQVGDIVLKANSQETRDTGALNNTLATRKADEDLNL